MSFHFESQQIHLESAALRRLAAGILGDGDLADEALQQTRIALWRRGGAAGEAFVRGVVRNIAAHLRRDERRRREHEREAAERRAGHAESTDQALARHEVVRRLAEAVAVLREPFRECVVLRFYEDVPPREIARRLGVPVATVRSRLQRGLAALRSKLDRRGAREAWRRGLALAFGFPLRETAAAAGITLFGTWIMSKVALGTAALILSLLVAWGLWSAAFGSGTAPATGNSVRTAAAAGSVEKTSPSSLTDGQADLVRSDVAAPTSRAVVVLSPGGTPVAGATVFSGPSSNALQRIGATDERGRLLLRQHETHRFVLASGAGHSPSPAFDLTSPGGGEIRLVLGDRPTGRVTGRVLDPVGKPLPNALVYTGRGEPPSPAQAARGLASRTPGLVSLTDAEGRFALDGVLAGWFRFIVCHERYAPLVHFHEMTAGADMTLEVRLQEGVIVTGRATTRAGLPAHDATVDQGATWGFETRRAATAADGSFRTGPLLAGNKVMLRDGNGRVRNAIRIPKGAGPVFVWNPIVGEDETRAHGQVLAVDRSTAGLFVRIGTQRGSWHDECQCSADGSFEVALPKGRMFRVAVFAPSEHGAATLPLLLRDVTIERPGAPLLLELPADQGAGTVTARLVAATPMFLLREVDRSPTRIRAAAQRDGEVLRWDDVPGGAVYRVIADLGAAGSYALARIKVPPGGDDLDLGTLALPATAAVTFRVDPHESATGSTLEYLLERTDDNAARVLDGVGRLPRGPHQLPPGRYRLDVELTPGGRHSIRFAVDSAAPQEIVVPIDARPKVAVEIHGLGAGVGAKIYIAGTGAQTNSVSVLRTVSAMQSEDIAVLPPMRLIPGDYRVDLLADDGRRARLEITVLNSETPGPLREARVPVSDGWIRMVVE